MYDVNGVRDYSLSETVRARNELEITDVNNAYIERDAMMWKNWKVGGQTQERLSRFSEPLTWSLGSCIVKPKPTRSSRPANQ